MALNIGVNVREVDGLASPTIQAAPTSVAAFIGLTERGAPDQPVRITNSEQFQARFGNYRADGYLAYAITGFFGNGGREAYLCRVVGAGSTAAATTLNDRQGTPAPALQIRAGYRGRPDPGDWGNQLRLDVRDDPRGSTTLQADTAANADSAQINSVNGFQVGSVVRFVDGSNTFYRRITAINTVARIISWDEGAQIGPVLNQATTEVSSAEFRLVVRYQVQPMADFTVVEEWPHLSMETDSPDYVADRLNHPVTGSRYITATDISGSTASGLENPAIVTNHTFSNGNENTPTAANYTGSAAQKTGFFSFDTAQVQLLAAPDAHTLDPAGRESIVRSALDYCAGRGDCMFVGSAPDRGAAAGVTPRALSDYTQLESDYVTTIKSYAASFQATKVFGALYAPWIRVNDPVGVGPAPARFVPVDGHVMGVYARTEQERGIWKAPAGVAAQVRGALEVAAAFTDGQHTDLVRNGLVNGIRREPNAGIIVAASRTLSTDTRWWFVNVRLLFNFVKVSVRDGLRFVRQEPHTAELRQRVRLNVVIPFLLGLWRQGAFGAGPPEQVFSVKCDVENNPPEQVNLGNFRLELYFYPSRPAETILLIVGQHPGGALAGEA